MGVAAMVKTLTAVYDSAGKARNAEDDLVSTGIDREKVFLDTETNQVKVMVPDTAEREVTEILKRHDPTEVR